MFFGELWIFFGQFHESCGFLPMFILSRCVVSVFTSIYLWSIFSVENSVDTVVNRTGKIPSLNVYMCECVYRAPYSIEKAKGVSIQTPTLVAAH